MCIRDSIPLEGLTHMVPPGGAGIGMHVIPVQKEVDTVSYTHLDVYKRQFQRIISTEARKQILEKTGKLPDAVVACVGGGSNSIGMFADFINDKDVDLIGVEAGGLGIETGKHASAMALGCLLYTSRCV